MFVFWLIARSQHRFGTGPLDRYFTFLCAHCAAVTAAMVRTSGFGSGSSPMAAEQAAHAAADGFAYRAISAAACPGCGNLQPHVHAQHAQAAAKARRQNALRLPLTVVAALLVAMLLAFPAIHDLRHSVMLGLFAVSAAGAVGALVFAIASRRVPAPSTDPRGLWFAHDPSRGPSAWFPAQAGHAAIAAEQPAPLLQTLSLVALGITGVSALVALIAWSDTFRKVTVVSAARGPVLVRMDGIEVGTVMSNGAGDAPHATFEVRTSSTHRVVVVEGASEATYELDPAGAKHGWVVAPHNRERGLCLASIDWHYGGTPRPRSDDADPEGLLEPTNDVLVLPHSFDHLFEQPPATIQLKSGETAVRTSLRALDCTSLPRIVRFRDAPPHR